MGPDLVAQLKQALPEFDYLDDEDWQAVAAFADWIDVIAGYQWSSPIFPAEQMDTPEGDLRALRELLARPQGEESFRQDVIAYWGSPT
jgi:hypothetical protein